MDRRGLLKAVPQELRDDGSRLREIFELLPDPALSDLLQSGEVMSFGYGDVVLPEGARSDRIGYVVEGALGMQKRLPDGRMHLIGLLVPTDMYGRLFDGGSAYDLVSLAETRVYSFERGIFEAVLADAPEVERRFLVSLLDELDAAREWVLLLGGHKVVERVASFLLVMMRRELRQMRDVVKSDGGWSVRIPIRRSDLAHHLGARPESISRALHALEKKDVVRIVDPYTIRIHDLPRLVELSGADLLTGVE